jgi:hypothetical protein
MKTLKYIPIFIGFFAFNLGCSAANDDPQANLKKTVSGLNTRIASLETDVVDQVNSDLNQWDVISFLYTQMPYALGTITPKPPGYVVTTTVQNVFDEEPTITPPPGLEFEYPLNTRTGIVGVDTVIDAFLNEALFSRISLVRFINTPCKTGEGFDGPPKCKGSETENTIVEAFPILYTEGFHVRSSEIEDLFDFPVVGLLAVYIVPPDAYETEYWPAGEYGVIFSSDDGGTLHSVILLVEGGQIVRLDYDPTWPPFTESWDRGDTFVLPPRVE